MMHLGCPRTVTRRAVVAAGLAAPALGRSAEIVRVGGPAGLCGLFRRHRKTLLPADMQDVVFDGTSDGVNVARLQSPQSGGLTVVLMDGLTLAAAATHALLAKLGPDTAARIQKLDPTALQAGGFWVTCARPWLGTAWNPRTFPDLRLPNGNMAPDLDDLVSAPWRSDRRVGNVPRLLLPDFTATTSSFLLWQAYRALPGRGQAAPSEALQDPSGAFEVIGALPRSLTTFRVPERDALQRVLRGEACVAAGLISAAVLPLIEAGESLAYWPGQAGTPRLEAPIGVALTANGPARAAGEQFIQGLVQPSTRQRLQYALHMNGRRYSIPDDVSTAEPTFAPVWETIVSTFSQWKTEWDAASK